MPHKEEKYIEAKNKFLINVKKFTSGEKKLLKGLKMEKVPLVVMKMKKKEPNTKKNYKISEMKMVSLITEGFRY